MKHRVRLLVSSFSFALLLLYSCEKDGYNLDEYENPGSHLILEARNYFEEYASIEMEGEPTGLHPGNIAPEWDKAKVFFHAGTMAVNVPLITEATYEGSFYSDVDTASSEFRDTYYTAMLQKLVVVKNLGTGIYSCYVATIIPSEENATKNSSKIDKTFYGGDPESKFSGTVVYSTVTTNYTISVEKYANGTMVQQKSLYYAGANLNEYLNEMSQLLGAGRIKRNVRTMTKNGEYGGGGSIQLPEVVIVAPAPPPPPPPSLPPPPPPPAEYPSYPPGSYPPGSYPPGYVPPTSPPNTGGGGGNQQQSPPPKLSSPNPDYDEITKKVNDILLDIYEKLKEMGIDLNDYKLVIAEYCLVNVRIEKDGAIGICASFVNKGYTLNDQTSIIWHEVYHVNNDINCSLDKQRLPSAINYSDIPNFVEDFYKKELSYSDIDFKNEMRVFEINDPAYYKNEIAAYQAEMNNGFIVSSAYEKERKSVYWKHQQDLKIAEQYYNK